MIAGARILGRLSVDTVSHKARLAETAINEGDWLSIDGGSGAIYLGRRNIVAERPEAELAQIKNWPIPPGLR